jgi:hypothetical protein
MRTFIAAAAIAIGLTFATPAQAHCPNACSTDWHVYTAGQLGVQSSGPVSDATGRKAVAATLGHNTIENLFGQTMLTAGRTSSTSGWVWSFADFGYRYTPERVVWLPSRYDHYCQYDEGHFAAGSWRVRCTYHGRTAH